MQTELPINNQKTTATLPSSQTKIPPISTNHENGPSLPASLINSPRAVNGPKTLSNFPKSPLAMSPVSNAWRQRSPNVSFSCDRPKMNLADVMSEQLADKLEIGSYEIPVFEPENPGFEPETVVVDPEHQVIDEDLGLDASLSTLDTSSDALLAKMLQNQMNKEFNQELELRESQLNTSGSSKVITSLKRYRLSVSASSDDSTFSSHEDQDALETLEDNSYFEDVGAKLDFTLKGRNAAFDPERNEFVSKHDVQTCYAKNAQKMESFPTNFNTGDTAGVSMNNNIFNGLKNHAWKEKRCQQKAEEKRQDKKEKEEEGAEDVGEHGVDNVTKVMLSKLVTSNVLESVNGVISIGKEAVVLHAKGGSATPDNQMNSLRKSIPENIAVKVFKTVMSEFRHRDKYIQDDYRFCDRFKKLNSKKLAHLWAEKEARNLERLESARIPCPEVVLLKKHILFLRFIGNVSGTGGNSSSAAPKLSELNKSELDEKIKTRMYQQTVDIMKRMYKEAKLIHADLSEYNLLWHENKVWVIDVAQAVEPNHPKALELLYRDCCNVVKFFGGKMRVKEVLNSRQLFLEVCKLDLEIEVSEEFFDSDQPSSKEIAEFTASLEEVQRRAKDHADSKRDAGRLDDERVISVEDNY